MIIFRQKDFAVSQDELDSRLENKYIGFMEEILKYLLLYPLVSDRILNHWCEVASGILGEIRGNTAIKLFLGLVDNYKHLPRKRYTEKFARRLRKDYQTASEFIDYMKDYIRTKRANGEVKYAKAMESCSDFSNEDIIRMCKYIALCLTDQLNPEIDSWYDNRVKTTQVNWEKELKDSNMDPKYLRKIMKSIKGEK